MAEKTLKIHIIAAMNENGAIGIEDEQGLRMPFHIPYELKYFKNKTWSFPIIMGYKTFISLGGTILDGRYNIVLSKTPKAKPKHKLLQFALNFPQALEIAKTWHTNKVFIIGGANIYAQALPIAHRLYLSKVQIPCPEANIFFPKFSRKIWKRTQQQQYLKNHKNPYQINFEIWEKL